MLNVVIKITLDTIKRFVVNVGAFRRFERSDNL